MVTKTCPNIATRKKHSRRSDRVRGEEFVKNVKEKIDGNPGKSMRAIAKEMDVGSMTIVRTIHEDLGLKSYALRKGQLLTENMKNNRKGKAAALLNNLKHDSFGMLRFFSDEKNFDVDQKVNPRNDRWICKDPSEIPVVMHTKFPASVMVLGVISSEGDVMPPHFFEKGLRMNADTYINVLETVVKPWMDMVAAGRNYQFKEYNEKTETFETFYERLEQFLILEEAGDEKKKAYLLTLMGSKTYGVLKNLCSPILPKDKTFDNLIDILKRHFSPKRSIVVERFIFFKRMQLKEESISDYLVKCLASSCNFGNFLEDSLRDKMVCGLYNAKIQNRILSEGDISLAKVIEIALSMEAAEKNTKLFHLEQGEDCVDKLRMERKVESNFQNGKCKHCGKLHKELCRFKEAMCFKCNKKGHIASICWSSRRNLRQHQNQPGNIHQIGDQEEEEGYVQKIISVTIPEYKINFASSDPPYLMELKVEGNFIKFEMDTGSGLTLISEKDFKNSLQHLKLEKASIIVRTYDGTVVPILGKINVKVECQDITYKLRALVVKGEKRALMGREWINRLKLGCFEVKHMPVEITIEEILKENQALFVETTEPIKGFTFSVNMCDVNPIFHKARPVPFAIRPAVTEALDKMVAKGYLCEVASSKWATPVVVVPKKNKEIRICCDFKVTLNKYLDTAAYPLPTQQDLFSTLAKGKYFSKLDLRNAYLQLEVDPGTRPLLTINTHKGLFRFKRMPFGLANAPSYFQSVMDRVLSGIGGVICYIDDVLIATASIEEHLALLKTIFARLAKYNIKLKKEKCLFLQKEIEYLGHLVTEEGIRPLDHKVQAIQKAKTPTNISELRSFLGLVNFYGKFIPNLPELLKPLHELLHKKRPWVWTKECGEAIDKCKNSITSERVLVPYDATLPLCLATDASQIGVGAVLSHIIEGQERPIMFASRTLLEAEQNYSQIEKEALAIIYGVTKFHQFIYGRKFILITDHKPLVTALIYQKLDLATASIEEHLALLKTIFARLAKYNIKLKKEKCLFLQKEIEYLGHLVTEEGIRPLDHKVQAIQKAKTPTNISELRSFLGLVNFYGKFIPNLPELLKPLHELLHKKRPWVWTKECGEAIDKCKNSITSERVLVPYDATLPLCLATDASQIGVGAVLSHIIEGQERPIMFASRTLLEAEQNYSQIEKEALAIIYGVTKFHQFIYGRKFILITDHKPLVTALIYQKLDLATASIEEHLALLKTIFARLAKYNIKLKKEKCLFLQKEIEYLGHLVTEEGIRPLDHKVQAIQKAKTPTNISELRSFLGLVNFYGKFIPNLPELLKPLHELLHKKRPWVWTKECGEAIDKCKNSITSERVLVPYDATLPLCLATDASQIGVGAVLSHIIEGQERPIMFASRTLSEAEQNYSQIEKEALAIIYGVTKFHQFIYGRKFILITDHKPLVTILGSRSGIPTLSTSRLQRWALILSAYTYDIKFRRTQDHGNADLLSRFPVGCEEIPGLNDVYALSYVEELPITAEEIATETEKDEVLSLAKFYTQQGWPEKVADHLRPYFQRKLELTVDRECLVWGMRVVIPPSLRIKMLNCLHETHSGMNKMKAVARSHFWWPNLDTQIEFLVNKCRSCQQSQDGPNKGKWQPWIWSTRPWQRIHIDFANKENINLIIVVDSHSKWIEAIPMRETTTRKTIEQLRRLFSSYGLPEELVSDNGPQFTGSEMKGFLEGNGIKQTLIPAYHPQNTLSKVLLAYRSTPHVTTGKTPSELFIGRALRTRVSLIHPSLASRVRDQQARQMKYDRRTHLEEFQIDDLVWCKNFRGGDKWIPGKIVGKKGTRVYTILIHGQVKAYHRDQIRKRWRNGEEDESGDGERQPEHSRGAGPSAIISEVVRDRSYMESLSPGLTSQRSDQDSEVQSDTDDGKSLEPLRSLDPEALKEEGPVLRRNPPRARRPPRMPGHRKRRQFKQTDAFTRDMVIGLKRAGWSIRQIAADTHLGASTVHRLWRRWLEQGNVAIYRNVGATRVTSARVDRRILRQAVAAPQATCTAILQHVQDTLDHSISTRTISRRLVANGLHSCRPLRRLPLTPPNRRQRLEWCRARSTWMTEWHRVVFSDESRFCLSSDSRRVRVWRRRGERSNPAAIVERPTVRQRGIMVWGAIAYDSRSPLLRIQGTMTAQRYVDDVLRPVTLPYLQGVPNALYQQDNARPHTARISQQALQDVQMLPWPPYSPDLSPIEHVWDIIGRRLHALPQPRSEDELWQMVEREWRAIPQDAIRTLIDSLPRRVAACIAVRD
ncbi:K02A2.6-like, partial [Cordylochernes scorpioides]